MRTADVVVRRRQPAHGLMVGERVRTRVHLNAPKIEQ
jgi:hypothetical protein